MFNSTRYTQEEFEAAIHTSNSYSEVMRKLGLAPSGGNHRFLKQRIRLLALSVDHFTGQSWAKNKQFVSRKSIDFYLKDNFYVSSSYLKQRLLREKLLNAYCDKCGISSWLNAPLTLHLDHIDGNNLNNRLQNLRLLCPNCHSQTATYCGRNISLKNTSVKQNCDKRVTSNRSPRFRKFDPTFEELQEIVWKFPTTFVAKHYGVSDKAIEKRCRILGIDKPPRGYWAKKASG